MVALVAAASTAGLVYVATMGLVYAALAALAAAFLLVLVLFGTQRTGVVAMMGAFATAPMYRGIEGGFEGVGTPTDLLVVLAAMLLLPGVARHRIGVPVPWVVGLSLVAVCGLIASAIAERPVLSIFFLLQWLFFIGVLPLLFAWWRPDRRTIAALLWSYLAGHTVSTAYALAEGPLLNNRYDGLSHHTNAFALAGLASVAILLYLFSYHREPRVRAALLGVGVVAVASIAMSGSRAALVVAAVLVLMVPVVERSALWGFALAGLGALLVVAFPLIVSASREGSAIARLAGDATTEVANQSRDAAFDYGIRRFSESPVIGSGLVEVELIHNIYLEVAVAIGVLGLGFYLLVLAMLARPLFSHHPLRRLSYMAWAFIGVAPALPGLWDRTLWVPLALAVLPMLKPSAREDDRVRGTSVERLPAGTAAPV